MTSLTFVVDANVAVKLFLNKALSAEVNTWITHTPTYGTNGTNGTYRPISPISPIGASPVCEALWLVRVERAEPMNESLETILDQPLMVAEQIGGRDWNAGPLDLAVAALRQAGLTKRHNAARVLGYPPALCQALEGACQVLTHVDDRRTIAVSIFTEIPPRPHLRRHGWRRQLSSRPCFGASSKWKTAGITIPI